MSYPEGPSECLRVGMAPPRAGGKVAAAHSVCRCQRIRGHDDDCRCRYCGARY